MSKGIGQIFLEFYCCGCTIQVLHQRFAKIVHVVSGFSGRGQFWLMLKKL